MTKEKVEELERECYELEKYNCEPFTFYKAGYEKAKSEKRNDIEVDVICMIRKHYLRKIEQLEKENAELKSQIEKMNCCTTCVNHTFYIPQVDSLVKGKDDTKCENCIHYSLNKLEDYRKGKELVDNWQLAEL